MILLALAVGLGILFGFLFHLAGIDAIVWGGIPLWMLGGLAGIAGYFIVSFLVPLPTKKQ
jgi:hypothetical protein